MRVIRTPSEHSPAPANVCLAIGVFDGVHLGHQQVIRQALWNARDMEAQAVVVTFDRHPSSVVAPERVPPLIQTQAQRLRSIEDLKVETTLLLPFTEELSRWTGQEFIDSLLHGFGKIRSICVGSNFTFGHRRSGNVELLKTLGEKHGFIVHGLSAVALDGAVVSSTRIRDCIRRGDLDGAGQMLGRAYALGGKVIKGNQLGRTLGFPTANLDVTGLVLPPYGVYAGHVEWRGRRYRSVLNLGIRPTITKDSEVRAEVHLLDFSEDIYGEVIEMTLARMIRGEKKFDSLDALKEQIQKDIYSL